MPEEQTGKTRMRVINDFTYHPPFGSQIVRYGKIRDAVRHVALMVLDHTPASREQSLALTHLEEAVFWANAAIARNEKPPEPETAPAP